MLKGQGLPKRDQPRNSKGEFGSLPTRPTPTPSERPSVPSEPTAVKAQDLATIYARFKETHGRAPVIGLDLDGTTANMAHGLRARVALSRGISPEDAEVQLPEPAEYDYVTGETAWFASRDEFLEHFRPAEKDGMYRDLPAYAGSNEVLHALAKEGFEIKAVTARSAEFNPDTAHWLASQGFPDMPIFNPGNDKQTIQEVDVFIDDSPHVINTLVENERKVIIFNQEYNGRQVAVSETHTRRMAGWSITGVASALGDLL